MKMQLELSTSEVQAAVREWLQAKKPEIVKGQIIHVVLNGQGTNGPAATITLDPQPTYHSGDKD